jgi:hypothetical protein
MAQVNRGSMLQRFLTTATCCVAMAATALATAAQGNPSAASGAIQLQPYTAPDQSASAGVPSGWKVTSGSQTVIQMSGPQGETIFLGKTFIARNAPFQLGQKGIGGTDLSMPYSVTLTQKLTMILQQAATIGGNPSPQLSITSAMPIQLPPTLGQCGRFVASSTAAEGPVKLMGALCSLPLDSGGIYKNIMLLAQAPAAVAAEDAPIASAVFSSYKIPNAMLVKKLAPFTAPPIALPIPGGVRPGIGAMPMAMPDDTSADCFDLGVIRALPPSQLPQKCGGRLPN